MGFSMDGQCGPVDDTSLLLLTAAATTVFFFSDAVLWGWFWVPSQCVFVCVGFDD
jgi:hypothetical protein